MRDLRNMQNHLKAVFWDYPDLNSLESIKKVLQDARNKGQKETIYWIMTRFLERGRIRDTAEGGIPLYSGVDTEQFAE